MTTVLNINNLSTDYTYKTYTNCRELSERASSGYSTIKLFCRFKYIIVASPNTSEGRSSSWFWLISKFLTYEADSKILSSRFFSWLLLSALRTKQKYFSSNNQVVDFVWYSPHNISMEWVSWVFFLHDIPHFAVERKWGRHGHTYLSSFSGVYIGNCCWSRSMQGESYLITEKRRKWYWGSLSCSLCIRSIQSIYSTSFFHDNTMSIKVITMS